GVVENVRVPPIGVKRHVPRSRAGSDRCEWYRVRGEHTRSWIEIQDVDLVRAEVDAEHVTPIQVREDLVRVGRFLAIWIGAGAVAGAEEDVGHGADRAVSE